MRFLVAEFIRETSQRYASPRTEREAFAGFGLGPEDLPIEWRLIWEERAAVMEYDGGIPRERAEALALSDTLSCMERARAHAPRSK